MTYTATTPKAAAKIKSMTTRQLIETFILTGAVNDPHIYTVRGWIMDELETRNPEAWEAYLDSDSLEDEDLLKYFPC